MAKIREDLRAYLAFMWSHPGKKLLFMGGELAQAREWNYGAALDWSALNSPFNAGVQRLVSDLNQAYRGNRALHARDTEAAGFSWIEADSAEESILIFARHGTGARLPADRGGRQFHARSACKPKIGLPAAGFWKEIINTDGADYGGSNLR